MTVMAPLAGITNLPFRLMVKGSGCGLVCSEMISANGLVYGSEKTIKMLQSAEAEKPLSVQLFGSDSGIMAEAAAIVESTGADILDINFGCSVRKVLKTGAGSALMREPEKAESILKAVRKAVSIPVTIKIRSGWSMDGREAVQISKIAQACGINAIAVHPRTGGQGFKGKADWSVIRTVKNSISIPVIGNGDITLPEHAGQMISETGCDGIMIGRAAIGNPWIFRQVIEHLQNRSISRVELHDIISKMKEYLRSTVEYFGEKTACYMMRSRLGWFVKGLPHNTRFRETIKHISSEKEAVAIIHSYGDILTEKLKSPDRLKTGDTRAI